MVEAVREEVARGATLDEVKQRVTARLAPTHEKAFFGVQRLPAVADGGSLGNIERTFAMVS